MNKMIRLFISLLLLLMSPSLLANLISGGVSNTSRQDLIAYDQSSTVMLRWSVVRNSSGAAGPGPTVSSAQGAFFDPATGRVLETVGRALSKTEATGPIGMPQTIVLTESLTIPLDLVRRARAEGLRNIGYQRSFTDCPGGECSTLPTLLGVKFAIGGSIAGPLRVTRLSLRFADDSLVHSVEHGMPVRAYAEVTTNRPGLVRGAWEIASPGGGIEPRFETVQLVSQYVPGGGSARLESPVLRSDSFGAYLVRFRLIDPTIEGTLPLIRYYVLQSTDKGGKRTEMRIVSPAPDANFSASTRFEWSPVAGAVAYKIVVAGLTDETIIAGALVNADSIRTTLPGNTLSRLQGGQPYRWRVQAIGNDGAVIGVGPWQRATKSNGKR